ncbi:MAG: FtsX-like permease family protein [Candidatus Cloacimonetes bacterium]|nr:FtsX-like permease family protein [Candidatus Cloacimonadota bacterium]
MLKFLAKGLVRDRSRSFFPILIIAAGVMLTVIFYSWLNGYINMLIEDNARFDTGHVKIVTRAYNELIDQKPYDLAMMNVGHRIETLSRDYPQIQWQPRIYFGGILDVPDENKETLKQGKVAGLGVNLLNSNFERDILNLEQAIKQGKMPSKLGEILISRDIAEKLGIQINDEVTMFGSTMYGSITMQNFIVSGIVVFGVQILDKGAVIIDISDVRKFLDMEDSASEILGFIPKYNEAATYQISAEFNEQNSDPTEEFSEIMIPLKDQGQMAFMINVIDQRMGMFIFIFIFVMSLVLWNSGLMNGIRRYGEIGVRLAIGESKGHIYRSLILESIIIGITATIIGTGIGLIFAFMLQHYGINISSFMKDAEVIMNSTMRAQITPSCYVIGFIPGVFASIIGACFAGIGIYRRNTAQLFKELET